MKRKTALALLLSLTTTAQAETITSADIVAAAASIDCIDYQLVGVCFWLDCDSDGCWIETSPKIGHHNPDLVVSAHNGVGNNPWTEANGVVGQVSQSAVGTLINSAAGVSAGSNQTDNGDELNGLKFKSSDAIGHPAASVPMGYRCPSQATSLNPYFVSGTDSLAWRLGIPEVAYPDAIIPGRREIGSFPTNTWGSVYPRSGFLNQSSDAKSAAVIAQRVGDIVTRSGQPHVYQPLTGSVSGGGMKTWPPGALKENTDEEGQWQMLAPEISNSCEVFGENDIASVAGWDGGKQAESGNYAWTLWRPYQCCKERGIAFLYSVNFQSYP